MRKLKSIFFIILIYLWAIICLPLSVIIFYLTESYELSRNFSLWIDEKLKQ